MASLQANIAFNNLWNSIGCYDPCIVNGVSVCTTTTSDVLTTLPNLFNS